MSAVEIETKPERRIDGGRSGGEAHAFRRLAFDQHFAFRAEPEEGCGSLDLSKSKGRDHTEEMHTGSIRKEGTGDKEEGGEE